ncbi:hypothetical protein MIND_00136400 [Mycena indigotica]|uniref:F-box domain-containing protein n=1 Tax=Mycena indigotica TaxID=2126181 RepID=A0A8H6TGA1_9AGAR|nr:uncharacterized protein MIND_00136400 [Mycena indigotica]KAF7316182.1 hypothetical protein MIND_00136400 [Mycena indigotica]
MLPLDLLPLVLDHISEDRTTLLKCLLTNSQFKRATASILYSQVVLRPKYGQTTGILDRLLSATLHCYAPFVHSFSVQGLLLENVVASFPIAETLLAAIKAFVNLKTLELVPDIYPDDFFTPILQQALELSSLQILRVNSSCMSEADSAILANLVRLRVLELRSPTRAILNILPDWLTKMDQLTELHLTSNCGSVTPGVLRQLVPLLQNVTAIALGLSYSIIDDDLLEFLGSLPNLKSAQLQHYLQYKRPANELEMRQLRSLTVLYNYIGHAENMDRFCNWVCRVITGAPIEHVKLCCDEYEESSLAPRTFDTLLKDLASANYETLHTLDLGGWLVSVDAVSLFLEKCKHLEEFSAALDQPGFEGFERRVSTMTCLHTSVLKIYAGAGLTTIENAERIMKKSVALRRLSLNELKTEGSWVSHNGETLFVVREIEQDVEDLPDGSIATDSTDREDSPTPDLDNIVRSSGIIMGAILEEEEDENEYDMPKGIPLRAQLTLEDWLAEMNPESTSEIVSE